MALLVTSSASTRQTLYPLRAKQVAMLVAQVDFPTPPLKEIEDIITICSFAAK